MARKLLIAIALLIAALPHLGLAHSLVVVMTTVLALFMAAVLLFSKKPKIAQPENISSPQPEIQPETPAIAFELPVIHPEDGAHPTNITDYAKGVHVSATQKPIPSPLTTPLRKHVRSESNLSTQKIEKAGARVELSASEIPDAVERRSRVRKPLARVMLSEEQFVQPADATQPRNERAI